MLNPDGQIQWPNFNPYCTWIVRNINTVDSAFSPKEVFSLGFQECHPPQASLPWSLFLPLLCWLLLCIPVTLSLTFFTFVHHDVIKRAEWNLQKCFVLLLGCFVLIWFCMPSGRAHILQVTPTTWGFLLHRFTLTFPGWSLEALEPP